MVITLDKVRLCLQQAGQSQEAPLRLLSDQEATDHLWTGAGPGNLFFLFLLSTWEHSMLCFQV